VDGAIDKNNPHYMYPAEDGSEDGSEPEWYLDNHQNYKELSLEEAHMAKKSFDAHIYSKEEMPEFATTMWDNDQVESQPFKDIIQAAIAMGAFLLTSDKTSFPCLLDCTGQLIHTQTRIGSTCVAW
jgi:hypothetical protein